MTTPTTTKQAPAPRLKVKVNGNRREIFMSFGLLNEICRGVGDLHGAIAIPTNAELRDYSLMVVLSTRDEEGTVTTPVNLRTLDISIDDADQLLGWISDHATDFFLRTMERVVALQNGNKDRFKHLSVPSPSPENSAPTPTGSAA